MDSGSATFRSRLGDDPGWTSATSCSGLRPRATARRRPGVAGGAPAVRKS